MKRTTTAFYLSLLVAGCIDSKATRTPELVLNVEEINFCAKEVGETYHWNNLQLRNTGSGPVTVHGVSLRGDQDCVFGCRYQGVRAEGTGATVMVTCPSEGAANPPPVVIAPDTTLLLQLTYTPSAMDHTDSAALVVTSDAENIPPEDAELKTMVVPMCGTGVASGLDADGPDTASDTMMAADAGSGKEADAGVTGPPAGAVPDAGEVPCTACAAPPEKGAPGCQM
jgi:hypothetical protein